MTHDCEVTRDAAVRTHAFGRGIPLALLLTMTGRIRRHALCLRVVTGLVTLMFASSGSGAADTAGDSGPSSLRVSPFQTGRSGQRLHAQLAIPLAPDPHGVRSRWRSSERWTATVLRDPTRNWPLRADPRRWPRLFANTTECTLNFDPIRRRHRWR